MPKSLKPLPIGFQVDGHTDSVQVSFAGGILGRVHRGDDGWKFEPGGNYEFSGGRIETLVGDLPAHQPAAVALPRRMQLAAGMCRPTLAEMLAELHRLAGDKPAEYCGWQDARRLLRPLPRAWREAEFPSTTGQEG